MTALDHTTKRGTRHELLVTARLLRERGSRLSRLGEDLIKQADELEAEGRGEDSIILRGRQITDALHELVTVGEVLHYRELARLLLDNGKLVGGREPTNTMLAALQRDPHWKKVGKRSGRYRREERAA